MIRLFNHYFSLRLLALTLIEAIVLFGSVTAGERLRFLGDAHELAYTGSAAVFTSIMLLIMTALGMYHENGDSFARTVQRLLVAFGLSAVVMSAVFYLFPAVYVGRGIFALSAVLSIAGVLAVRMVFFRIVHASPLRRKVMVVGSGDAVTGLVEYLNSEDARRTMTFAGLYPTLRETADGQRRETDYDDLPRTIEALGVDEVVIAARERRGGVLPLRQLLDCKLRGVKVLDTVSFYERERGVLKIDDLRASWLVFGQGFDQGLFRDIVKRVFDIIVAAVLLVLTLPLVLLASLAIIVESGRPVLFRQERVGEHGHMFTMYKLRSMRRTAEREGLPQFATANDARVTTVGRFIRATRIDELPQLVNVLLGDMSFVGPRPERPFFVEKLREQVPYYEMRHSVKPGLTGWAQVRFRYGASLEDSQTKLQYDLYYVKNHSLFLDLLILVETMQVVLMRKGAR